MTGITTRFMREWLADGPPATSLTAAATPTTATIGGVGGLAQLVGIRTGGRAYIYQATTSDTPATVRQPDHQQHPEDLGCRAWNDGRCHGDQHAGRQPLQAGARQAHAGQLLEDDYGCDLICYLVRQEGQNVWVDAGGRHTRPAADPATSTTTAFPVVYVPPGQQAFGTLNVAEDVQLERSLTIAKDIKVTIKSWNAESKTATTRTVDGKGSEVAKGKGEASSGSPQTHVFVISNLTPDAALKYAQTQARI